MAAPTEVRAGVEDRRSQEPTFIVTFGFGQVLENCYTKIQAKDMYDAASKMHAEYGSLWSFVYESEEAAGVEQWQLRFVPFGTPNWRRS